MGTYDDWKADIKNVDGSAPCDEPEDDRGMGLEDDYRDEDEPFVCPGCQAINDEPHAEWCPDWQMELDRDGDGRSMYEDFPEDDHDDP